MFALKSQADVEEEEGRKLPEVYPEPRTGLSIARPTNAIQTLAATFVEHSFVHLRDVEQHFTAHGKMKSFATIVTVVKKFQQKSGSKKNQESRDGLMRATNQMRAAGLDDGFSVPVDAATAMPMLEGTASHLMASQATHATMSVWDLNSKGTQPLTLFNDAFNLMWSKIDVGTVLLLIQPSWKPNGNNNSKKTTTGGASVGLGDAGFLSISSAMSIKVLGRAKDLGRCKGRKGDPMTGDPCDSPVNMAQLQYCEYHIAQARADLMKEMQKKAAKAKPAGKSGTGAKGPNTPSMGGLAAGPKLGVPKPKASPPSMQRSVGGSPVILSTGGDTGGPSHMSSTAMLVKHTRAQSAAVALTPSPNSSGLAGTKNSQLSAVPLSVKKVIPKTMAEGSMLVTRGKSGGFLNATGSSGQNVASIQGRIAREFQVGDAPMRLEAASSLLESAQRSQGTAKNTNSHKVFSAVIAQEQEQNYRNELRCTRPDDDNSVATARAKRPRSPGGTSVASTNATSMGLGIAPITINKSMLNSNIVAPGVGAALSRAQMAPTNGMLPPSPIRASPAPAAPPQPLAPVIPKMKVPPTYVPLQSQRKTQVQQMQVARSGATVKQAAAGSTTAPSMVAPARLPSFAQRFGTTAIANLQNSQSESSSARATVAHPLGPSSTGTSRSAVPSTGKSLAPTAMVELAASQRSTNEGLVVTDAEEKKEKKLNELVEQEKVWNALDAIEERDLSAVYCFTCDKYFQGRPRMCSENGHKMEGRETVQRWFKCDNCDYHLSHLGPHTPFATHCPRCTSSPRWTKTSAAPRIKMYSASTLNPHMMEHDGTELEIVESRRNAENADADY